MRWFPRAATMALAAVAFGSSLPLAHALMIAMRPPAQRAITAQVVVVGKVTAIEKDMVEAQPFPNAPDKVAFKVAVVKIENNLAGAANTTHIKVAFVPPPKPDPNAPPPPRGGIRPPIRRGPMVPDLKEGQEMLFFLTKHPGGDFYIMPAMSPPLTVKDDNGKKELEAVKKITTLLADPMKGLKSEKAEVRAETAAALVMKYRTYPEFAAEVGQVPIDKDESRMILKALTDADWSQNIRPRPGAGAVPTPLQAFYQLALTEQDGFKPPMPPVAQAGQPPVDFGAVQKKAFVEWLSGAGKDYVIKKFAPKK